jgi:hypothetical protein
MTANAARNGTAAIKIPPRKSTPNRRMLAEDSCISPWMNNHKDFAAAKEMLNLA